MHGYGAVHEPRGIHLQRFGLEDAEMLVETCAPDEINPVPRLKDRLEPSRAPSPHQPHVPAMRSRHGLQDDAGFAMPAGTQDDSLVAPFHAGRFDGFGGEIKKRTICGLPMADSAPSGEIPDPSRG